VLRPKALHIDYDDWSAEANLMGVERVWYLDQGMSLEKQGQNEKNVAKIWKKVTKASECACNSRYFRGDMMGRLLMFGLS
jgi:hypothetical protein